MLESSSCTPHPHPPHPSLLAMVVAAAVLSSLQPLVSLPSLHVVDHGHVCFLLLLPLVAHSLAPLKNSGRCAATGCESFLLLFVQRCLFTSPLRPLIVKSVPCNKQTRIQIHCILLNTEVISNHYQSEFCFPTYNIKSTIKSCFAITAIITH